MALQFILGGSGSGKTRYLYDQLIEESQSQPKQQFFAVVPEQFTMQTQRELVSLHPNHGVMNVDIVSFNRLAYRVFEELAVVNLKVLDDMGKSMVLRKVAANQKEKLVLFQNQLNKNGFISELKSMLSEFFQYGLSPEVLERETENIEDNPLLKQKMKDLLVMYRGFQEYIKNRFVTVEEILEELCKVIPRSELIKGSIVTLDGFTGFTPIQYRLLGLLMRFCKEVRLTVTIDSGLNPYVESGNEDIFHMSRHMVCRMIQVARDNQVEVKGEIRLGKRPFYRFVESPALDFLERQLLRYPTLPYSGNQDSIRLFQALNPGKEVEETVTEILSLVRHQGFRYRDIAVITGDLSGYSRKIIYQFEKNEIPYFMDEKKNIMGNPMVELIRAALEVVSKDFSYESVFRYLKTGLVTEDQAMICRVENYVLALGIRGFKRWDREWEMVYGREESNLLRINEFRKEILEPLREFRQVLREKEADVSAMTRAVTGLLTDLHVEEQLLAYGDHFSQMGEHSLAKEYEQIYGLVMELADRIVALLGDEVMGKKEYADILDAGFQEIKVGLIPATLDRVVVGDITRTRIDHVKALFFLGMNDGVVPSAKSGSGVLTDGERELLKKGQLDLAPTAKEDGFMQRFYLYLMMTKPSRKLYVSYSATSSAGKSLRPSYLVGTLKRMFPDCQKPLDRSLPVLTEEMGRQKLALGLKEYEEFRKKGEFLELLRWYYSQDRYQDYVEQLAFGAFYSYQEKGIGKAAARALYGTVLSGSVTRMEQYAACAYAHFLKYGLELSERKEYQLASMDMGNLFHASIDLFFQEMRESNQDWNGLTEENRKQLVGTCVEKAAGEYGNTIFQSSARNAYLVKRVERITDRTIWALTHQIQKGDFVPADFEVSFSPMDNLKALKLSISDEEQLNLKGRIDRLDLCHDGDKIYVKIIDYKSGGTTFDLPLLYYGLQLQLVVYLDAVMEQQQRKNPGKQVVPAGIFYYNINDPLVEYKEGMSREEIDGQMLRQLRMNGLVNSDLEVISHLDRAIETESDVIPVALKSGMIQESRSSVAGEARFQALRGFVREKLKDGGKGILKGDAMVLPYKSGMKTACDYCPYHPVCGFDLKTPGYRFKRLVAMKSEEIWKEIEGGEEDGGQMDDGSTESH